MRFPGPVALWLLGTAVVVFVAGLVLVLAGLDVGPPALAASAVLAGAALVVHAKRIGDEPDHEPREQKGPGQEQRRRLLRLGGAALGLLAAGATVPAFLRTGAGTARLRDTGWQSGVALIDDQGRRIRARDVTPGNLLTVFPEGRPGSARSQAILVGVEPERLPDEPEIAGDDPALIAYSKLCTHMACPVGLYQPQDGTVVCPCHQAVFDLLDGGQVVIGPANRPLPRLPITIDGDGFIVASGDLSDVPGTGFWRAP